ncbi:hypothetical protein JCM8202v2_006271 [Rhodotorula sphaerocarpa]
MNEGDLLPTGPVYTGAGPYDPAAPVTKQASTASAASRYSGAAAAGGYVPSSVVQQQYGVSYVPGPHSA